MLMRTCALLLLLAATAAGCSTIVKGTDQEVTVVTPGVEAAKCVLTGGAFSGAREVTTPGTVTLGKSKKDTHINCEKQCYEPVYAVLQSEFEGMTLGNLLLGGVIGLGVDAASGALNKYDSVISIQMAKGPSCETDMAAAPATDVVTPQATEPAATPAAPMPAATTPSTQTASGGDYIVAAAVPEPGTLTGCSILTKETKIPAGFENVYGPTSFDAAQAYMVAKCS